jgi:hypothetical protein
VIIISFFTKMNSKKCKFSHFQDNCIIIAYFSSKHVPAYSIYAGLKITAGHRTLSYQLSLLSDQCCFQLDILSGHQNVSYIKCPADLKSRTLPDFTNLIPLIHSFNTFNCFIEKDNCIHNILFTLPCLKEVQNFKIQILSFLFGKMVKVVGNW